VTGPRRDAAKAKGAERLSYLMIAEQWERLASCVEAFAESGKRGQTRVVRPDAALDAQNPRMLLTRRSPHEDGPSPQSMARSIVNAHGGRLWADVNAPHGAVFRFTLPDKEKEQLNSLPAARQTGAALETLYSMRRGRWSDKRPGALAVLGLMTNSIRN
jgi:hypothetical protein